MIEDHLINTTTKLDQHVHMIAPDEILHLRQFCSTIRIGPRTKHSTGVFRSNDFHIMKYVHVVLNFHNMPFGGGQHMLIGESTTLDWEQP